MREGFAVFVAVLAAAVAAAGLAVLLIWLARPSWLTDGTDLFVMFLFAFAACFAYSMLVGIPSALFLVHKNRFRFVQMTIAGAIAGILPGVILLFSDVFTHSPSLKDLAVLGLIIGCGGLAGAASGASFFGAHRLMSPNNSFKPKPLRGSA